MTFKVAFGMLSALLVVAVTQGEHITDWGDGNDGTEFVINQGARTILIREGNGNTYKFFSETSQGNNIPGEIINITVDPNATGDFSILILHDDETTAGASDLAQMNLQYAGGTSTVIGIKITGRLGDSGDLLLETVAGDIDVGLGLINDFDASAGGVTGDITFGGNIVATLNVGDMTGSIDVGGGVFADISAASMNGSIGIAGDVTSAATLNVGDMTGNITVGNFLPGAIVAASLTGNIAVQGTAPNSFSGDITINSSYGGTISTAAGAGGDITIGDAAGEGLTGAIILSGPGADDGLQGTIPPHSCERTAV